MVTTRQLKKAFKLAGQNIWRKALLKGVGATIEHSSLKSLLIPRTVIDIGANKGQFSLFAIVAWPECQVVAFEPLPTAAERFRKVLGDNAKVRLVQSAIGTTSANATMYLANREDSSSLLPISQKLSAIFPQVSDSGKRITVNVAPLDCFISEGEMIPPVLLKIDVQGYELEVLKGCDSLLPKIQHLYVECSYVELYEGQAMFSDIENFLNTRGFRLVATINLLRNNRHEPVQGDFYFARN